MATIDRLEHLGGGWIELMKSPGVQRAVDEAGERIVSEANGGYAHAHFKYYPKPGNFTSMGFASPVGDAGRHIEARDKPLARAVHP